MLHKLLAYNLLLIHLTIVMLSGLPGWFFIVGYHHHDVTFDESQIFSDEKPLTGDITFLRALIERAKETDEKATKPVAPERPASSPVLYFMLLGNPFSPLLVSEKREFLSYNSTIFVRFLRIPSPPPRFV